MKRKLAAVALLLYAPLVAAGGGCCLTNRLWSSTRDLPRGIAGAEITADHVLRLAVRYESGETRLVTAHLFPGGEWTDPEASLQGGRPPRLPPVVRGRIDTPRGPVEVSYMRGNDRDGTESHTAWINGQGYKAVVDLPEPYGGRPWSVALAVLATPFTFVADLVTYPVYVAWIFFTAGGHGHCWIPWCDGDR